jgi:hypothetical protein
MWLLLQSHHLASILVVVALVLVVFQNLEQVVVELFQEQQVSMVQQE